MNRDDQVRGGPGGIPLFKAGKGGAQIFSAAAMNRLVVAVNALLKLKVQRGATDGFSVSDANSVLQIQGPPVPNAGAGGGGASVGVYRLKSVQTDYVTCAVWDWSADGATVLLAKEWKLRALAGETIFGVAHTYTYAAGLDSNNATRTNNDGTSSEAEIVVPPWVVNEIVFGVTANTGVVVSGTPVTVLLIRTGVWARKDPITSSQMKI